MAKYREITEIEANWIERNMRQLIKDMMEDLDMEEEEVNNQLIIILMNLDIVTCK